MAERTYEVIVERKLTSRFVVTARSGAEAAMQVGQYLADEHDQYQHATTTEVDRKMRAPAILKTAGEPARIDDPASTLDLEPIGAAAPPLP